MSVKFWYQQYLVFYGNQMNPIKPYMTTVDILKFWTLIACKRGIEKQPSTYSHQSRFLLSALTSAYALR